MGAEKALEIFLRNALGNKKERYLGFISNPKKYKKFLNAIHHELEKDLDPTKKVKKLPDSVLSNPGYMFNPPNNFGEPIDELKMVCNSSGDSFLVVSVDGEYAIHGPETYIDSRAFYKARLH